MVDIHSHYLFGVDDGPESIEGTVRILENALEAGITDIISTSHGFSPQYHVRTEEINGQIDLLKDIVKAAGYDIRLHAGQEVRLHEHLLDSIENKAAITLADSRYLLLELPTQSIPAYVIPIIEQLLAKGIIPIIAHPERNRAIAQKPERLERLVRHGALAQITAGSLSGHFGKNVQRISVQLIQANLIHTYGSDVHNLLTRPLLFNEGLDYLEKRKLHGYVDILLENNSRILTNESFIQLEPGKVVEKKWWHITTSSFLQM